MHGINLGMTRIGYVLICSETLLNSGDDVKFKFIKSMSIRRTRGSSDSFALWYTQSLALNLAWRIASTLVAPCILIGTGNMFGYLLLVLPSGLVGFLRLTFYRNCRTHPI